MLMLIKSPIQLGTIQNNNQLDCLCREHPLLAIVETALLTFDTLLSSTILIRLSYVLLYQSIFLMDACQCEIVMHYCLLLSAWSPCCKRQISRCEDGSHNDRGCDHWWGTSWRHPREASADGPQQCVSCWSQQHHPAWGDWTCTDQWGPIERIRRSQRSIWSHNQWILQHRWQLRWIFGQS